MGKSLLVCALHGRDAGRVLGPSSADEPIKALPAADPNRPALTCEERTVTRAQLESRANRLARAFAAHGVKQGDIVTVALANGIELVECLHAVWKLGAVPQPVSARLPARELERIVALAEPALAVGLVGDAPVGSVSLPAGFEPDPTLSDDPLPARVSPAWKAVASGGSTGQPKLIVSGANGRLDVASIAQLFRMGADQVQLVASPMYHNAPLTVSIAGSLIGQHVVLLPRFDAELALAAIDRHDVGFVSLVPTMMLRMLRVLDQSSGRFDLGSLETVWHTGGPCPAWLKERWIGLVGADHLYEMYGGTESQAITVISGAEWLAHRGSVGQPTVGEMKIVDADGHTTAPHEVGEIVMRRPSGTAPTYRYVGAVARELGDGWESLGDLGYFDEDGYLYLVDRRPDVIVSGGANVFPAEVEGAILEHPVVLSCAVVGLPDDDLGERVHAVVQAQDALTADALVEFLAERLARYKRPRSFRFVDESLRDDAGKVRRSAVRDREIALAESPAR
jgi:bile acid-coenzyme A ligase